MDTNEHDKRPRPGETPDPEQKPAPDREEYARTLNESARLLRANRPGEAITILERLHRAFPHDPDVAINLGGALILQRKWNQAVRVLKAAAQSNPDNAMLWMNLGAAQLGRLETSGPKQQQAAIAAFEQALRIDASTPNAHYHLALIYKEQGNLSRASALFQRALEVNPKDRDARYWMDKLSQMIVTRQQEAAHKPPSPPAGPEAPLPGEEPEPQDPPSPQEDKP